MSYSEAAADVSEDIGQWSWSQEESKNRKERPRSRKLYWQKTLNEHCGYGMFTAKNLLFSNMVADV